MVLEKIKKILDEDSSLTLESFQKLQEEYDRIFVDDEFKEFDKVRHTYAHMGKLLGRLAEYVQMVEDGHPDFSTKDIKEKVIPDLLVYSVWLSKEFDVNIEEEYLKRIVGNIERLHKDKVSSEELQELKEYIGKETPKSD